MKLEELRAQIDHIDERLFDLLKDRLKVVEQVGHLKKNTASDRYIIRAGREALKVKKAWQIANEAGYDKPISQAFASLWREIISLSINHESKPEIVYNPSAPEILWMLREYFGTYSSMNPRSSDQESFSSLQNGSANIAAFTIEPQPASEPWWLKLNPPEFSIFASLPLFPVPQNPELPLTLLVSNVTPEPCGEDKFVYLMSKPIPDEDADNFTVISRYKDSYLVICDEFYNNYQSKLKARYLGCYATFDQF